MHSRWLAALILAAATSTAPAPAPAQSSPQVSQPDTPEPGAAPLPVLGPDAAMPQATEEHSAPERLVPRQGVGNGGGVADQAPANRYRATPQEALRVAQGQLQMAVMRLQKARDFTGPDGTEQLKAARDAARTAMQRMESVFETLQSAASEAVHQAIRNARIELQSAKEALASAQPDAPDAAIQALKDLHRAAAEVRTSTELAAQPPASARPGPAMD